MAGEEQGVAKFRPKKDLGDRYQVIDTLGQGGMGVVLKARHSRLGKLVAIKVLNSRLVSDDISRKRFEIEAQAGSKLSHPNLVSVFDYGFTKDGDPYLVMEYLEGKSLEQRLLDDKRLDVEEFLETFIQVCKALQFVHANSIVHRDLKCSNIMLQNIGTERYAKLLDFGIAKVFNDSADSSANVQLSGARSTYGSPLYMSPEQCQGKKIDSRSDIYSLGCVMYECLTGLPPIRGENSVQTIFKHITDSPAPIQCKSPTEQELSATIQKCLKKDPVHRFQSASDLLAALSFIAASADIGFASGSSFRKIPHRADRDEILFRLTGSPTPTGVDKGNDTPPAASVAPAEASSSEPIGIDKVEQIGSGNWLQGLMKFFRRSK